MLKSIQSPDSIFAWL